VEAQAPLIYEEVADVCFVGLSRAESSFRQGKRDPCNFGLAQGTAPSDTLHRVSATISGCIVEGHIGVERISL
jgi:hypothetical protein